MALGGGTFLTQNKILPGSYINFISASRASANLSDRGYAAMPLSLDWGIDGEIFTVEVEELEKESLKIFGYPYIHEKLKGIRDLFKNIKTAYLYKLNTGEKADSIYATAKYSGIRGNDLKIIIQSNIDDSSKYDVHTFIDSIKVDTQIVKTMNELIPNDFVNFKTSATIALTAGTPLTGGTNGAELTGVEYQTFLDKIESYSFNSLGCISSNPQIKALFVQFTKRMRDDVGAKFQTIVYRNDADYEGVINLHNDAYGEKEAQESLVYWTTGVIAGCAVNKSNTNKKYDGEFKVNVSLKQSELKSGIKAGKFIFHKVGNDIRVLEDINSFISFTEEKNIDFSSNQTMRVLDQIANDIAVLFNTKYLGNVPNDKAGRISFWNDIVKHHQELQKIRAIESFKADNISVEKGDTKKSVVVNNSVMPTNAMSQLYMTVTVL